jgi:hypothetical protein
MKATKADIATVLKIVTYAEDHTELKRIASVLFPDATRCEVSQNISNNGPEIEALTFFGYDDQAVSLPKTEGEAHSLIQNNVELARDYEAGRDPVEFLRKRYQAWTNSFELQSTVFDDYVHFDFDEPPGRAKPLYATLPGYVVIYPRDLNENPEAHLAFSREAAQTIAAHLATETYRDDASLKRMVKGKNVQAALEYATETYGFVCDILEVA